jgi:hypothetical protein
LPTAGRCAPRMPPGSARTRGSQTSAAGAVRAVRRARTRSGTPADIANVSVKPITVRSPSAWRSPRRSPAADRRALIRTSAPRSASRWRPRSGSLERPARSGSRAPRAPARSRAARGAEHVVGVVMVKVNREQDERDRGDRGDRGARGQRRLRPEPMSDAACDCPEHAHTQGRGPGHRHETTTDAPNPKPVLFGSCANCGCTMSHAYIPAPSRNATRRRRSRSYTGRARSSAPPGSPPRRGSRTSALPPATRSKSPSPAHRAPEGLFETLLGPELSARQVRLRGPTEPCRRGIDRCGRST